ncbi:OmpA family protein [Shewanella sp. A25]|nr:OmpA family protein [Shewanella shenzhenensis]
MLISKLKLLILLSLLPASLMAYEQVSDTWRQSYEGGRWDLADSPFKCSLTQLIPGIGEIRIERKPEEKSKLILKLDSPETTITQASVIVKQADWQREIADFAPFSAEGEIERAKISFKGISQEVLSAIGKGAWLDFRFEQGSRLQSIVFTNNQGRAAIEDYRSCISHMAPLSWETARDTVLFYDPKDLQLHSAENRKRINDLVNYMTFDNKVTKVLVDGHSDNLGDSMANRAMSQQVADDVASRLVDSGLTPSKLEIRAHGNRYPAYNNSQDEQHLNRRVTIRLIRNAGK